MFNALGVLLSISVQSFGACQQIWEVGPETNASFGTWEGAEFHSNGHKLSVLYSNVTAPVGTPFGRYVVLVAAVPQPGVPGHREVLAYRSDNKISNVRVNWYGDVAFVESLVRIAPGQAHQYEDQIVVCSPSSTPGALEPTYACAANRSAGTIVDRIPQNRTGIFGPNTAADGQYVGLEWSLAGLPTLTFANYRFNNGATTGIYDYDHLTQGAPVARYVQPVSIIQGGVPSVMMRLSAPDELSDTVASEEVLWRPGFFPSIWGLNFRVHDRDPLLQTYTDTMYHGAQDLRSFNSFASIASAPGGVVTRNAFYARQNAENTSSGLYVRSSLDAPAYSVERRVSAVGAALDYDFPVGVIGRVGAMAVGTSSYANPLSRKTEFYVADQAGVFQYDQTLVPPTGSGFTALGAFAHPDRPATGYRVGGFLEDAARPAHRCV